MDTRPQPFVSVVVPHYNDRDRLEQCLNALEDQTYPSDRYEIIVVDNGSREPVAELVDCFPHARSTLEERPGSYAARNTGIELARGEVLAFTDADCIPDPDWIACGVKRLCAAPEVGLVGGRVRLTYRNPNNPTIAELYERLFAYQQEANIHQHAFGSTSNVFTHRRVIEDVGPFNSMLKSAGDVEWGHRVAAARYLLVYAEDAIVDHPSRPSIAALMSRRRRIVGGGFDLSRQRQWTVPSQPRRSLWGANLLKELRKIVREPELNGPVQRAKLIGVVLLLRWAVLSETIRLRRGGVSLRE